MAQGNTTFLRPICSDG